MNYPLIIGGSAGSYKILKKILSALPKEFTFPIIICVHRLKSGTSNFSDALSNTTKVKIQEANSGNKLKNGVVYIAPADHHLVIDEQHNLILNQEAPIKYSRPSIDITMISFASLFKDKLIGILLTGANTDGTAGLKSIKDHSGITIVQDPLDAEIPLMPESAIKAFTPDYILSADEIIDFILKLTMEE